MLRTASTLALLAVASALSTTTLQEDAPAVPHGGRELRSNRPRSARRTPVRVADDEQPGFEF